MSQRRTHPFLFSDPTGWFRVATHVADMMQASSQVIAHRTALMGTMGVNPSAADRRELRTMVKEKADATAESAAAMTTKAGQIGVAAAAELAQRMVVEYARWWGWPMAKTRELAPLKGSSSAAAAIVDAGVGPYRRRSQKNARRLRKR